MIYLDSSVALAQLLTEDRTPPDKLWTEPLISSRLLEYEIWCRLIARKLDRSHGEQARALLGRVAMIEMAGPVLARALEPFPVAVRILDALHLSSLENSCVASVSALIWRPSMIGSRLLLVRCGYRYFRCDAG